MKKYFSTKKLQQGGTKLASLLSPKNDKSESAAPVTGITIIDSVSNDGNGGNNGTSMRSIAGSIAESIASKATSTAGSARSINEQKQISMDWDKIYVEIDNDANGASIDQIQTGSSSMLDSKDETYDDTESYTIMEDDEDDEDDDEDDDESDDDDNRTSATPCLSNINSRDTIGNITRNVSSHTSDADDYDGTMMVPTTYEDSDREMTADDFSITKNGKYLSNNHFANAQLMRWKHAAEEGPAFIQILAFLAALCTITSTVYPIVTDEAYWTIPTGVCAFHTTILCILIVIFEVRAWGARNPMSLRARVRNLFVRYLNVLRFVWGRGLLYIFTGSLNIAVFFEPWVYYTGFTLIGLGLLAILIGAHASFNLERLRLSLTDDSFLWSKFVEADVDKDHMIGISEFSNLVWSLGLELDDAYTYRAFNEIDQDADSKINFHEFKAWWIASQDGDETIITVDISKETAPQHKRQRHHSRKVPGHINV